MLTKDVLVRALDYAEAVDLRPFGHMDHDAQQFRGPSNHRSATDQSLCADLGTEDFVIESRYEMVENIETGAISYLPKHK